MTKAEIISQLKSLRDSTADYAKGNDDPIFKKDVEALDAAIDFLKRTDHDTPIIRCKDCTKWERYNNTAGAGYCHYRKRFTTVTMPNDFCSYGERKEDGNG